MSIMDAENMVNISSTWIQAVGTIGAIEIKVEPQDLYRQSVAVSKGKNSIMNAFNRIENTVNGTKSYWSGEASDIFRSAFSGYKKDIDVILARISEHVTDLNKIAGVYDEAENKVENEISSLPTDVII